MKYSLRDLLLRLLDGPVLLPVLLLICGMFVSYYVVGVDLSRLSEDPLPLVGAFGVTASVLLVARYLVRVGLKSWTRKTTNEPPPSWGNPPPLPPSQAKEGNPPENQAGPGNRP
jgi:hypothetical protein